MNHQTETESQSNETESQTNETKSQSNETESQTNEVVNLSERKSFISRCQYYYQIPRRCLFIQGLVITKSLTELAAVSVLMPYLTYIRETTLVNAAASVNILEFLSGILSVPACFLKDYHGCYRMVLLATQFYYMGMAFLSVSTLLRTSHSIPTNPSYLFENLLLYMGLFLIALGKAGSNSSCVKDFFGEQLKKNVSKDDIDEKRNEARQMFWMGTSQLLGVILGIVVLAVVNDWKFRFGFCAVTMQLALGVFLVGSPFYTTMGIDVGLLQFKCFEKATTITDTSPPNDVDEQERTRLQRNDEVNEIKKILLLLGPISVTFLIYGIVKSIGSTFFLDQRKNMKDSKNSGILIPPIAILIIAKYSSSNLLKSCIKRLLRNRLTGVRNIYATLIIIGVGLIFSIICCATAQAVEAKRLGIVVEHGLQDITGDKDGDPVIPMSVFWLLPQFIFLGAMKGLVEYGMESFFESELPMCMRRYASEVTKAVTGIGTFVSVGLVSIATKASTVGGGSSWFANTVNRSHLDRFYRSLTILCMMFCFVYAYVSTAYMRKRLPRNEEEDCDGLAQAGLDLEIPSI